VYTLFVAVTDEVTLAEKDDFLGMVSHHPEMLRVLPDDYLRSLPPDIEQTIRHRIARADD